MFHGNYRLREAIHGVKLEGRQGSGVIAKIPGGTVLRVRGPARLNNMLEVDWYGIRYAVFEADICERCDAVSSQETAEAS
jgi:hypothetical protein